MSGAQEAARRGVSTVACATFDTAGFKDQSLPSAGIFDVLEHVEDDVGFLKNIHRKLVPGGRLFITVPAYNYLWSEADEYAGHYRRYSCTDIESLLRASGYDVLFSSYFFSLLLAPIFLLRSIPFKLGRRKPNRQWRRYQRRSRRSIHKFRTRSLQGTKLGQRM